MAYLTVRNLPDALHAALTKLAAANRRSINAEVVMAIEDRVATAKKSGALQDEHNTHIELSFTQCYYAWCSAPNCTWQSPYRKSESEVKAFALKHEANAATKRTKGKR